MKAQRPRVSIGLPVCNGGRFLSQAIDSLLAQTFTDFELIISDNGSTDDTGEICRRYAGRDARIRYVRQPENRGAIWNFNHVFELAHGEYYRWHAHDDLCGSTFLQRCVDLLDGDPAMVQCHTQKARIDEQGRILGVLEHQPVAGGATAGATAGSYEQRLARGRLAPVAHERFRTVLLGPSYCLDCFGLIRSAALRKTRMILPYFGSEKVLSAELSLLGTCGRIREPLFFSRRHAAEEGSHGSAKQQQEYVAGTESRRLSLTRLRLLWGHLGALWQVSLPAAERVRCFLVVGEYILQIRKWRRVVREVLCGAAVKSDERLALLPSPETAKPRRSGS